MFFYSKFFFFFSSLVFLKNYVSFWFSEVLSVICQSLDFFFLFCLSCLVFSELPRCHPTIPFSVIPFSSCPQSLPASGSFQKIQFFALGIAKVLEFQLQHQSFQRNPRADPQNRLVGSPCSPRDSQESSPTPQFKSINSSVFSFLHSPTLTSIHDHHENHSLD